MRTIAVFIILLVLVMAAIGVAVYLEKNNKNTTTGNSINSPLGNIAQNNLENSNFSVPGASGELSPPLDRWAERITKKPFGIKISPNNSPVQPEHFSGYHTGVDFEVFADEQDKDIEIKAICTGLLLLREYVSGYGGVAVQQCKLEGQDISVVYGHLKLSSIEATEGQQILAGEKTGILGQAYSSETSGERKHLHLAIHKGKAVDIKGYVQNPEELGDWVDIVKYLE